MSDQIRLVEGYPPWAPAPDAALVAEFHRWDMPLVGLIEQAGVHYLFQCIHGQLDQANLWAYVTVTEREVEALQNASGEALLALTWQFALQDAAQVALARNGKILVIAMIPRRERPDDLIVAASGAIVQTVRRLTDQLDGEVRSTVGR